MIEVREMSDTENIDILTGGGFGHLGMAEGDDPYVLPIHYVFLDPNIYIYTTEGMKWEIIQNNPKVCLNVDDIIDHTDWRSVVVRGDAIRLEDDAEIKQIRTELLKVDPTLTPAVSVQWMDHWVRENIEVILRIEPRSITGRCSVKGSEIKTPFVPTRKDAKPV